MVPDDHLGFGPVSDWHPDADWQWPLIAVLTSKAPHLIAAIRPIHQERLYWLEPFSDTLSTLLTAQRLHNCH